MFDVMATESIITNERVDDIPVLLTQIERMGVQKLIDKNFPTHGNWRGQSLGTVAVIWLTHILSQADHRLNPDFSQEEKIIDEKPPQVEFI